MSRTIRRKNIKRGSHLIPDGFKLAGYYTQVNFKPIPIKYSNGEKIYFKVVPEYSEPTTRERFERWKLFHGESKSRNSMSPGRYYRNSRMTENRSINKQELIKWLKNPDDYEPLFEDNPRSCMWDWS